MKRFTPQYISRISTALSRNAPAVPPEPKAAKGKRRGAVLVPLCNYNNEASILFTQRSMNVGTHRGQVSFPGGVQDDGEHDMVDVALRETDEECGITDVEVLGVQKAAMSVTNLWVTPVVGFIGDVNDEHLVSMSEHNPAETELAFVVGIGRLMDPRWQSTHFISLSASQRRERIGLEEQVYERNNEAHANGNGLELPSPDTARRDECGMMKLLAYHGGPPNVPIWGLTAYFLQHLLDDVLLPVMYPETRCLKQDRPL